MEKLIYVDDSLPGITRKGAGTGFAYYDPEGKLIRDPQERARLNAVALPPAYSDEWFCPAPNGHILATGYDDRGRKQYRYHPEFRRMREGDKFDRCAAFGHKLPLIRARIDDDLFQPEMTMTKAVACVVRLLDLSAIRVGNEQYTEANESFGATTLRARHAEISANSIYLNFNGKGGREREVELTDNRLANAVRRMKDLPGKGAGRHLFRYRDDAGTVQPVTSDAVNAYIQETMGEDFSAKHFRTWHASVFAYESLAKAREHLTIGNILDEVSAKLGNTPATARKSYIHPAVIERVSDQAEWRENLRLPRSTKWLTRTERGFLDLLEEGPPAEQLLAA
ncbi:DNA topoisomerase IB [Erythrobacter ani]|uniref:DNA topoisomerase IB n=1 Tax=Erythrobacter ani TaxID=2827235 RepID=A0ABS6SNV9_9SPHN|nr:DNA topoisomerase IB [Erythrobacter ani]MBV7266670.1 DNA topoisomerase IB [Erythrobacter ani]